jgi:hypothetical protein
LLRLLVISHKDLIGALHKSILGLARWVLSRRHILVLTKSLTTANTSTLKAPAEARRVSRVNRCHLTTGLGLIPFRIDFSIHHHILSPYCDIIHKFWLLRNLLLRILTLAIRTDSFNPCLKLCLLYDLSALLLRVSLCCLHGIFIDFVTLMGVDHFR